MVFRHIYRAYDGKNQNPYERPIMLQNEVDPCADASIEDIEKILEQLTAVVSGEKELITDENLALWIGQLNTAIWTINRFRSTVKDEHRQKILYRDRWLELREKQPS